MFMLMNILLIRSMTSINSQNHIVIPPEKQQQLDIDPLIVRIRIGDMDVCRKTSSDDCRILLEELLQCEQIIFNDSSFRSSQYQENLTRHEEILTKYRSTCPDTSSDYLIEDLFDLK